MFFQVRHFSPNSPAATITAQCGLLVGAKTAAHVCTGLVWGRLADRILKSRKIVLIFGLLASSLATLGYGFSVTFPQAIAWQILDGALNATVAMIRCMTAELQPEKKHRVKAFTLLPLFANFGSIIGPLIGGFLSSSGSQRSPIPGYPYAMPNICVAVIEALVAVAAIIYLSETFPQDEREEPVASAISTAIESTQLIQPEHEQDVNERTSLLPPSALPEAPDADNRPKSLTAREIWTPNVLRTMFAQFIISGHLGTFITLWAMLLSLPVSSSPARLPFYFSGGLGLQPHTVGIMMSAFGVAGVTLQVLVYPGLQERWGTIRVWRKALYLFPVAYCIAPFCALIPMLRKSPDQETILYSFIKWGTLLGVLLLVAAGRTGVVPATSLLINDCTPHPSVRGTIHTTGVICSNLSKSVFPPIALAVMSFGLEAGIVGIGFWFVAILAMCSIGASIQVREGPTST